jgi:hypothetical protein
MNQQRPPASSTREAREAELQQLRDERKMLLEEKEEWQRDRDQATPETKVLDKQSHLTANGIDGIQITQTAETKGRTEDPGWRSIAHILQTVTDKLQENGRNDKHTFLKNLKATAIPPDKSPTIAVLAEWLGIFTEEVARHKNLTVDQQIDGWKQMVAKLTPRGTRTNKTVSIVASSSTGKFIVEWINKLTGRTNDLIGSNLLSTKCNRAVDEIAWDNAETYGLKVETLLALWRMAKRVENAGSGPAGSGTEPPTDR